MIDPFREGELSISVNALANRIGKHPDTVRRWKFTHRLKTLKLGGRLHVTREAWADVVEGCNDDRPSEVRTDADRKRAVEIARARFRELGSTRQC